HDVLRRSWIEEQNWPAKSRELRAIVVFALELWPKVQGYDVVIMHDHLSNGPEQLERSLRTVNVDERTK
ncbi:unnamed protein product, partial [Amoebophrya sp. A25]